MLDSLLNKIGIFLADAGIKIVVTAILLIVGFRLISYSLKLLKNSKRFSSLDKAAQTFILSFINIIMKAVLIFTAISILGVPTASIIAILGSAGVAIGLALQGSLSNLAGGVILLIIRPFKVDDFVTIGNESGSVISIDIFYTTIRTVDNQKIVIPNGMVVGNTIIDATAFDTRRVDIDFSVEYSCDSELVKSILMKISADHPYVLKDPAPFARMTSHGDSAIVFTLRVWCKTENYWDVRLDIIEQVKSRFDESGISIPYQQLDVHIKK